MATYRARERSIRASGLRVIMRWLAGLSCAREAGSEENGGNPQPRPREDGSPPKGFRGLQRPTDPRRPFLKAQLGGVLDLRFGFPWQEGQEPCLGHDALHTLGRLDAHGAGCGVVIEAP